MERTRQRDESLGLAVVRAVASAKDVDPISLPPLTHTLDPDALDELFSNGAGAHGHRHLVFEYADVFVSIRNDDSQPAISVTPVSEASRVEGVAGRWSEPAWSDDRAHERPDD